MLDFYLIPDHQPKPSTPSRLVFLGGVSASLFDRLVTKGYIDHCFDVYSDFRWKNKLVHQITAKMKNASSDSDVKTLQEILNRAIEEAQGVIAFGD